jgi:hypothetical protein
MSRFSSYPSPATGPYAVCRIVPRSREGRGTNQLPIVELGGIEVQPVFPICARCEQLSEFANI